MNDRENKTFFFSPFRIDPARRLLTRNGEPIVLKPKEFDTLLVLVKEAGRVVDKDDLMAGVWPDSYVADGSLAKNISVLRKALGEGVIETHRGRGYRIALPIISELGSLEPSPAREVSPPDIPQPPRRWPRRSVVFASTSAIVLVMSLIALRFLAFRTVKANPAAVSPVQSILIEKSGGLDPLTEGFQLWGPDGGYIHALRNADNTGYDRWKLVTDDQNHYYRKLNDAEKDFALHHDWTLTCVCALVQGAGASDIDLGPGKGPRFDMGYVQEGDKYFVVLTTQISPQYKFDQKIEFPGVADVDHPHTFQLRFDHLAQTASLWIDGQLKASGYRGHHQYQEDKGLMFGAATYRDMKESSMVFREVRFEVPASASAPPIQSILIQKEGALDPLDEGFKLARPQGQYPQAIYNRETNGWDRWRIVSDDQNYYYRILSAAERDFALQRDWKLTCICAVESGAGEADIDLAGKGARFDMEFLQEGNHYFVALVNQLSPDLKWDQKIEFPGVGDVAHPHEYELRYDHVTQTASLWIDGQQKVSRYRGYHQFQDDSKPSLSFGTFIYGHAPKGSFVSRRVRFEVN